ncbi:DNA-directed RNA polymerase subunit K/omega [Methanocalculus alkaliphilus]|nr:DNA-directed RNA polymerase subunit K/omega [Methanocalculus alkaliphilus]
MGAPVLIKTGRIDPLEIALEEFDKGLVPITVKRHFGDQEVVVA